MAKSITPKFAHLEYRVLHELDISIAEYFLLDMVFRLSRDGWCNKKLDNIAFDMKITRRGVIAMRDRLIARGLLVKGIGNRLATSSKVQKVYFIDEKELRNYQKSALSSEKVQNVHPKSAKSTPKNNIETNIEKGDGYKKFIAAKNKLKLKLLD